jgi:hypothetical protein
MIDSKPAGPELLENQRALSRRAVIVYVAVAILIGTCLVGYVSGCLLACGWQAEHAARDQVADGRRTRNPGYTCRPVCA